MSDTPLELPQPQPVEVEQEEPGSKQVDIVVEDDGPSILEQVRNMETTTKGILEKIDYKPETSNDTVGEALSLAREAMHIARTRLEKNEQKPKEATLKKRRRKTQRVRKAQKAARS